MIVSLYETRQSVVGTKTGKYRESSTGTSASRIWFGLRKVQRNAHSEIIFYPDVCQVNLIFA